MCTPFQWTKQIASHYGGTRNGMVISWPKGIAAKGELRSQWHHCIDIVPTILEVSGITPPVPVNGVTQKPIEGVSLAYTFADAEAPEPQDEAIFRDCWPTAPFIPMVGWPAPRRRPPESDTTDADVITGYRWELYNVENDFSQAEDLAAKMPESLKDLQLLFYTEAAKYNVLPIDNSRSSRLDPAIRPV